MKKRMITALTTVFLLAGCASVSTDYAAFEGVQAATVKGTGGAKVVVDGMEIWIDGEPPRKFKIIGFIDETREASWMYTYTPPDRGDIVKKAREAGGNAIIKLNSQSQLESFYAAGGVSASDYNVYLSNIYCYDSPERIASKYAVIKYVK